MSKHGRIRFDKMREHEVRNAYGRRIKREERQTTNGLENLARELGVPFYGEKEVANVAR